MSDQRSPDLQGMSIVALGSFNPAIFQPEWFAISGLVRREEASTAEISVISTDVTVFKTEWFSMQVTDDRFSVSTIDPTKYLPLRDLVVGTFKTLEHTPLSAFGLNSDKHFRMDSEDMWHRFGHHYVPKQSWTSLLQNPGTRTVVVEGRREGCEADRIQIRIQPSIKVHPGVYMQVNQHYVLKKDDRSQQDIMSSFLTTVQSAWDGFIKYSNSVVDHLFREAGVEG